MRDLHLASPTFRSAGWRDVPVRPGKPSISANAIYRSMLGLSTTGSQKRKPRQQCVGARVTSFRGRRKDVSTYNLSARCVEFCDRHHLLRNKSRARLPAAHVSLAEFTLRLFGRLGDEACNIFYALPPHTIAAVYSGPINATTGHWASPTQR